MPLLDIELGQLAAQGVAGDTEVVVAFTRVESFDGPRAQFLVTARLLFRPHSASEHKVARRAADGYHAGAELVPHFVIADVGSARSHAADAEVVVADAGVAVAAWVIIRPTLAVICMFGMTSENLSSIKYIEVVNRLRAYITKARNRHISVVGQFA